MKKKSFLLYVSIFLFRISMSNFFCPSLHHHLSNNQILQKKRLSRRRNANWMTGCLSFKGNRNIFAVESGYDEQSYVWAWGLQGNLPHESPVVCIALPRQAQFMWNQCIVPWIDRVRLTRASFLKASGPMMGMSCLSLYHDDPGSHLCLRYPKMTSLVLSAQC